MGLETGTYINSLVETNPVFSDPVSSGDDHIRLLKATIKNTFPNISGAVTATQAELNLLDGVPAGLTTTEIGYLDGVTSGIQSQIDNIDASGSVTFENLNTNGDVGAGATQVAQGNHNHSGVYASASHNHSGVYAAAAHNHDAGNIVSGTLNGARMPTSAGGVGTYAFAFCSDTSYRTIGWTTSASKLTPANAAGNYGGSISSGSWRLMGLKSSQVSTTDEQRTSLYVRYA